jgi:hypothetical protein
MGSLKILGTKEIALFKALIKSNTTSEALSDKRDERSGGMRSPALNNVAMIHPVIQCNKSGP